MTKHYSTTQCCPKFDPEPWDEKEIIWEDKLFVRDTMVQFLHMPLFGAFGKKSGKMWKKIEDAEANPDIKDFIMLATESSPWKGELYINVTKEVPNLKTLRYQVHSLLRFLMGRIMMYQNG